MRQYKALVAAAAVTLVACLALAGVAQAGTTKMVKDIAPGDSLPRELVSCKGILLFAAETPKHGVELWRSDGTRKGTKIVKDIEPGSDSSWPRNPVVVDGVVYFVAGRSKDGREL